jgi:hypothetical protein
MAEEEFFVDSEMIINKLGEEGYKISEEIVEDAI